MNDSSFETFFKEVTGHDPFPYQVHFATDEKLPQLLDIPTGAGKTATVVLGWIWRRRYSSPEVRERTPRRLVYCLPMRVLVEQTRDNAILWLKQLGLLGGKIENGEYLSSWKEEGKAVSAWDIGGWKRPDGDHGNAPIAVTVLMGGENKDDWDLNPERDAIIIGTQDMLLSRALNRGYGMNRYRWPVHFGLFNNDCLWVMDEVQLMGGGLATSVQLHLFHEKYWKPAVPCVFLWMSATPGKDMHNTRDRRDAKIEVLSEEDILQLSPEEKVSISSNKAEKNVQLLEKEPNASNLKLKNGILDCHKPGHFTLVMLNTVPKAQMLYKNIKAVVDAHSKKTKGTQSKPKVILLHGRMRLCDRKYHFDVLLEFVSKQKKARVAEGDPGLILVSTQVLEAGVDVSADNLWSEIAPWPSVIQRLGRLNRWNLPSQQNGACARFWMPKDDKTLENAKEAPNIGRVGPYEKEQLKKSHDLLNKLSDEIQRCKKYSEALDNIMRSDESQKARQVFYEIVIRPPDFHELFSTEPDLAGGFTDISRFVRDNDQNADVGVFWADFKKKPSNDIASSIDILCSVPIYTMKTYLKTQNISAWEWNRETREYQKVRANEICPGMTLLLTKNDGGYDEELGWTGKRPDTPSRGLAETHTMDGMTDDKWSESDWLDLDKHLNETASEAKKLTDIFNLPYDHKRAVIVAAKWHDIGKAHPRWQQAIGLLHERLINKVKSLPKMNVVLKRTLLDMLDKSLPLTLQAKFPSWSKCVKKQIAEYNGNAEALSKELRVRFDPRLRHEVASALVAWKLWQNGTQDMSALSTYLIASHHGKVRTVLRSTNDSEDVFGVFKNEILKPIPGWFDTEAVIDTSPKVFGLPGRWVNENSYQSTMPCWVGVISDLVGNISPSDQDVVSGVSDTEPRNLGPFALAFLEMLVITSDWRASRNQNNGGCP